MLVQPRMYYFGPWARPGHYFFYETGTVVLAAERRQVPWNNRIDGVLQPGCVFEFGEWRSRGTQPEGEALLHHKDGWTALSFWDRTIDTRLRCSSTYVAEGIFTFDAMVQMAKARFAVRWNKMAFPVRQAASPAG
jgi:hypothetical protein